MSLIDNASESEEPSGVEVPESWTKCVITGLDATAPRTFFMVFLDAGVGFKGMNGVITLTPIPGKVSPSKLQTVLVNLKNQYPDAQIVFS